MNKADILRHLRTGHPVSQMDVMCSTALLDQASQELAALQEAMDVEHMQFSQLKEQYSVLERKSQDYRALTHPVRRLPAIVLQLIFLHCLPRDHCAAAIDSKGSPLLLTRICSQWRKVAISTPSLWSSIHVPVPHCDLDPKYHPEQWVKAMDAIPRIVKRRVDAINCWFLRSGDCTLTISLYVHGGPRHTVGDALDMILDAIIPFSARWGTLVLNADDGSIERLTNLPCTAVPRLHTLKLPSRWRIHRGMDQDNSAAKWAHSGVVGSPSLRALSYGGVLETVTDFSIHFAQLTSLQLHGGKKWYSVSQVADLLAKCPLLRNLGLDINSFPAPSSTDPVLPNSISLAHLENLTLRITNPCHNVDDLFSKLDLPALKTVELNSRGSEPVLAFLSRIPPTLETLIVDPVAFGDKSKLVEVILTFSNLKFLILRRSYYDKPRSCIHSPPRPQLDDAFLSLFVDPVDIAADGNGSSPPRLPNLATFKCEIPSSFSDKLILDFVKARKSALNHVSFKQDSDYHRRVDMESDRTHLASEGIKLQFFSYDFAYSFGAYKPITYPADQGVDRRKMRSKGLPLYL